MSNWTNKTLSPRHPYRSDPRNFLTPSKNGTKGKSPQSINKYAHIKSKVNTFWTQQEMQKAGVKTFFERKGTSSASSSASSSVVTSPDLSDANKQPFRRLQYQLSGDFAARIIEIRRGLKGTSSTKLNESDTQVNKTQE